MTERVEIEFRGNGINEKGYVKCSKKSKFQLDIGKEILSIDPDYYRPAEVDYLIGDASKAKNKLGWTPEYDLQKLIQEMVLSDIELLKNDK